MLNNYKNSTGSLKLYNPISIIIILLGAVFIGYLIATGGIKVALAIIVLPIILFYFNRFFNYPRIGLESVIIMAFISIGLCRYIQNIPFGLSIDFLLILTYIAVFFKFFYKEMDWSPFKKDISILALIWFLYAVLEFFNPYALSRIAWFYAVRGMSLYMLLTIPLTFLLFDKVKYLKTFLYLWAFFSILGSIKGWMQLNIGPDYAEQRWLNQGGAITHIIFGELRIFSFYSDAGQFGAAQGAAAVVGTIVALSTKNLKDKIIFTTMAISGFYGMIISGTRGAMSVPMFGFMMYLILRKNTKAIIIGSLILAFVFGFFRFTYLGQSNSHIRRMRTAFRPSDVASLQVRLQNRRLLKKYLSNKPFGAGIGSAGNWGRRFSPQGFLANVPTDSYYVQIWAEQGIVGLILHLAIMAYIIIKGSYFAMAKLKDPLIRGITIALICQLVGMIAASYGNGVFGQLPSGILNYMSMAFIFMSPKFDEEMLKAKDLLKPITE